MQERSQGVLLRMLIAVVTVKDLEGKCSSHVRNRKSRDSHLPLFCFFILWSQRLGQVTHHVFLFAMPTRKFKTKSLTSFLTVASVGVRSVLLLSFTLISYSYFFLAQLFLLACSEDFLSPLMSVILLIRSRIKKDINTHADVRFHHTIPLLFSPEGTWGICRVPDTWPNLQDGIQRKGEGGTMR